MIEQTDVGYGSGREASIEAPHSFAIPVGDDDVLLTPVELTTDHDTMEITSVVDGETHDIIRAFERSGDVDRQGTSFGAWRRIPRDGSSPFLINPPTEWNPPFEQRSVTVEGFSSDELKAGLYEVTIEFGLEEPRGREPPDTSPGGEIVETIEPHLDAQETTTRTIEWDTTASDEGVYDLLVHTMNDHGIESVDASTVSVTSSQFLMSFPTAPIHIQPEDVHQLSTESNSGVPVLNLTLDFGANRASSLFAVGSRVDAGIIRSSIPDGPNVPVDTLPDSELTAEVMVPDDHEMVSGQYVLTGWSVTRTAPVDNPYRATLELSLIEEQDYLQDLVVPEGEVYSIEQGENETYKSALIDGTAELDGVLSIE